MSGIQTSIQLQDRQMRIVPPGMLNDVAAVGNRVQGLQVRIGNLNKIPVNPRTDRVNNEMESLRGKISQAASVQEKLSSAMLQMDIGATSTAYSQLNSIIDSTEQGIRSNLSGQEQFNHSIRSGHGAANGLESSIKRYAAMLISA